MERNDVISQVNDPAKLKIMGVQFGVDGMDITYTDRTMEGRIVRSFMTSGISFEADLGPDVAMLIVDVVDSLRELVEMAYKREIAPPDQIFTGRVVSDDAG